MMRLKYITLWLAMVMLSQLASAAEAARIQNFDRWKNLPSHDLLSKGNAYWQANKVDSALMCFMILSNRYNEKMSLKDKNNCCKATIAIGALYEYDYYDYQNAFVYLSKAEKIAIENDFKPQLTSIASAKVDLQSIRQDIVSNYAYQPETLKQTQQLFHQAVDSHNHHITCLSLLNLIYYAMKHHHVDDISPELQQFSTLDISGSIEFKAFLDVLYRGVKAYSNSQYQDALDIFAQLKNHLGQNESPQRVGSGLYMTCVFRYVTWLALHNDGEAVKELDKAENIAREYQINDGIIEALRMKQEFYQAHGNHDLARENELKYFKEKDAFINRSTLLNAERQQFLLDIEEMNQEMNELVTQKRVRDILLASIALLSLLIIAVLFYVWRNYQRTKERNILLFQRVQQLLAQEEQWKVAEHEEIATDEQPTQSAPTKKYRNNPLDEQAKDELMQRIYATIESHEEIYREGFTLDQLAQLMGENPNYVSQVINEKTNSNFNTFINEYKIKEACRRLSDLEKYSGYTIEAVGRSVGFKSRANFSVTFKKFTGMTPTTYQNLARKGMEPTNFIESPS